MSKIVLVDHNGRILTIDKPTTPSQVEVSEEPLWKVAQREADRASTPKDTNK